MTKEEEDFIRTRLQAMVDRLKLQDGTDLLQQLFTRESFFSAMAAAPQLGTVPTRYRWRMASILSSSPGMSDAAVLAQAQKLNRMLERELRKANSRGNQSLRLPISLIDALDLLIRDTYGTEAVLAAFDAILPVDQNATKDTNPITEDIAEEFAARARAATDRYHLDKDLWDHVRAARQELRDDLADGIYAPPN